MIKLKDLLKENISGMVSLGSLNSPFIKKEEKEPVQELEYEPGNYRKVISSTMNLANELSKMRKQIARDLDPKERKVLDNVINDFQDYFASLKQFSKAIK